MALAIMEVPLPPAREVKLSAPVGAKFVGVRTEPGKPILLLLVNPEQKILENMTLFVVPPNVPVAGENVQYVDSFTVVNQETKQMFFLHVFSTERGIVAPQIVGGEQA